MGAGPANGAPRWDDPDPNVTTSGTGKKSVELNPEIVERVKRMKAVALAQSAELQTTQESLQTVTGKLTVQDIWSSMTWPRNSTRSRKQSKSSLK